MSESTSSTPTNELDAARDAVALALDSVAEAERVLSAKQVEVRTKLALVSSLRQALDSGDLTAAERTRAEVRAAQALEDEANDLRRVTMARRAGVRQAEVRLIVAEAVAGVGAYADDDECREESAALALELRKAVVPVLRKMRARDLAVGRAADQLKGHEREVPGLTMLGNDGFSYRGRRFNNHGETSLKMLTDRVFSQARAELIEEGKQEREQGTGNPDGGRLPLLSTKG